MTMPIDFGMLSSVPSTPSAPEASALPMALDLPPVAVAEFTAAMERPLADNKAVQDDFERAVKAFLEPLKGGKVEKLKGSDSLETPKVVVAEVVALTKPVVESAPVATPETTGTVATSGMATVIPKGEAVSSPHVSEAQEPRMSAEHVERRQTPVVERGQTPVVEAASVEQGQTLVAERGQAPVVDAAPVASPMTLKTVVIETVAQTKPVIEPLNPLKPSEEAVAASIQPAGQPVEIKFAVQPEGEAVEAVAARMAVSVERVEGVVSASEMIVRAAEAVADAILVTPGLMRGEGEFLIRLKPEVLDGSAVRIAVAGHRLSVEFQPQIAETAQFIERNLPQLQQVLVARIHSFTVAVSVRKERDGRV